tara:strand:- start:6551 stop:6907 length:357 start_codon:yes stop_codon:yes gene_type:complete
MIITLTFDEPLNISLAVGDTVWYTDPTLSGGYFSSSMQNTRKLGIVHAINGQDLEVMNDQIFIAPILIATLTFFMFSKDNKANLTSLTGYYAEARFINEDIEKAELFAVGSEVVESSK